MKTNQNVEVQVLSNGVVRVYCDGGVQFETQGEYVRVNSCIDSQKSVPSGEIPKKKS